MDAFGHDHAAAGRAALAGGEKAAVDGRAHGHVQVGIVQHHKRVLAAHLQLHLGTPAHAGGGHALASADGAGKAHARDALVFEQHSAHFRATAHHQVEHARRQACAVQDVGQRPGRARHHFSGLEHHGVAVGQGWGNFPGGDGDGEVPGGDQADHAQGLAGDLHAHAGAHRRQHLATGAQGFARKELEDGGSAAHFADGFGQGFAFFAGQQVAQLGLAGNDFVAHGVQDVKALLGGGQAPGREGGVGGCHGFECLLAAGHRVVADHVARVRGVGVLVGADAFGPLAADEVVFHGHVSGLQREKGRCSVSG